MLLPLLIAFSLGVLTGICTFALFAAYWLGYRPALRCRERERLYRRYLGQVN